MAKPISGKALRDRLLKRLDEASAPTADAWVQVLAAPGNRELLTLIGLKKPQSISALSEYAGRAQPNVSRSLTALINTGLVEVKAEGRFGIPTITEFGRIKATELGLLVQLEPAAVDEGHAQNGKAEPAFLSLRFADGTTGDDTIVGDLIATIPLRHHAEPVVAKLTGDLNKIVNNIVDHWWRLFYRRAAPFRLGEFRMTGGTSVSRISLALTSTGDRVEPTVRWLDQPSFPDVADNDVQLEKFERRFLDCIVRPVASHMRACKRYDRPIQSKLSRLEDTYAHKRELSFARTAGALGMAPYNLGDDWAQRVRDLLALMPNEDARLDFASAVLREDVDAGTSWANVEICKYRQKNALQNLRPLGERLKPASGLRPWARGTETARSLRRLIDLKSDAYIDGVGKLATIFGAEDFAVSENAPGALRAFQSLLERAPTIVVENKHPITTKFTLARGIGDFLAFQDDASCVSNIYSDRQALGRAFAAEFIAPAEGVVKMVEEDDQPISRVAQHYGAPVSVILHQYQNNSQQFLDI